MTPPRGIPLAQWGGKGEKLMNTFRKHALWMTRRFDSRLIRRPRGARAVPRIVAALSVMLAAAAHGAAAQTPEGFEAQSAGRARESVTKTEGRAPSAEAGGRAASEVPVKVYVAGTPEDPYIVARIGDFPEELGEAGKDFLKREFVEQFIRDVLDLGGERRAAALRVSLLPRQDEKEQECSFTFGDVSGSLTVRLAERSVLVLVSFGARQSDTPTLTAALRR
jgi:hypothetical protein